MRIKNWIDRRRFSLQVKLRKMIKCICSGEQFRVDEIVPSSESLATRDYSASGYSSRPGEMDPKIDPSTIEEAESSLRESCFLNYEEARALLGRLEFQKGNVLGALHVFDGIDVAAVTSKIKTSISRRCEPNRRRSQSEAVGSPHMSTHAISLLLEAIYLKAKSLQRLQRYAEAAQACKVVLDTVEAALPEGLPGNFLIDKKLPEMLNRAVEMLPELWKLGGAAQEAISAYRRALLYKWNLDTETIARIEKEFAIFLLYSGTDANPPNLRSQMESSFVPRNNVEEATLLLLILLRKFLFGIIEWDPSIMDHLSFALSMSGHLWALAHQIEALLPGVTERKERFSTLALCYYVEGEKTVALNLLRNMLKDRENSDCLLELLLASKICVENVTSIEEGIKYARKALSEMRGRCCQIDSMAKCLQGILLSAESKMVISDSERTSKQAEALVTLETAERTMRDRDPYIVYHLCLENAEQRKLDVALYYAKQVLKLEAGSSVKGYVILARVLSAQKRFLDAESVINAALDQTGRWDQGELLRTKAKLQIAQGEVKKAIETYTQLLAILQVRLKSSGAAKNRLKNQRSQDKRLEMATWEDLANVYTGLSQWRDAEVCLSKSKAMNPYSASGWHSSGLLHKAKGLHQEALKSFQKALDADPAHVPSLISIACVLREIGSDSTVIVRSFLTDALRLDRTNPSAWYNLGLVYRSDPDASLQEAAECFEAATFLEETAPVEPFQ